MTGVRSRKDDIEIRRTRLADEFRINGLHELGCESLITSRGKAVAIYSGLDRNSGGCSGGCIAGVRFSITRFI